MKRVFAVLCAAVMLLLLVLPAGALESTDAAIEAYAKIEAAVKAEFGTDEATGLAKFPDEFAGVWYDEENYLVMALTDLSAKAYYEERSGNPEVIRFTQVKYSLWDLLAIQTEISETYRETEQLGFFLEGAVVNVANNTLELTVVQGGLDKALEYYQGIYGDAISAVEGEPLMETPSDVSTEDVIRIDLWVIIMIFVGALLAVVLFIVLVVLIIRRSREKRRDKKLQAEQAAHQAAQAARKRKK